MFDNNRPLPIAMKIDDAAAFIGVGRTKTYELISAGQLTAKKSDKNLLVLTSSLIEYMERLPAAKIVDTRAKCRREKLKQAEKAAVV